MLTVKNAVRTAAVATFALQSFALLAPATAKTKVAESSIRDRAYYGRCVAVDDRLLRPELRMDEIDPLGAGGAEFLGLGPLAKTFISPLISQTLSRFGKALRRAAGADGANIKQISAKRAIEAVPGDAAPCIQFIRGNFYTSQQQINSEGWVATGLGDDIDAELRTEGILLKGKPKLFLELALKRSTGHDALALAPTYFYYGTYLKKDVKSGKSRGLVARVRISPIEDKVTESDVEHSNAKGSYIELGDFKPGQRRRFGVIPVSANVGPPPSLSEKALERHHANRRDIAIGAVHALFTTEKRMKQFHESISDEAAVAEFHKTIAEGDFSKLHDKIEAGGFGSLKTFHAPIINKAIKQYYAKECKSGLVPIDSIDDIRQRNCNYYVSFERESEWFQHFHPKIAVGGSDDVDPAGGGETDENTGPTAFNLEVTLVETRSINQFLLFLSDVFSGTDGPNPIAGASTNFEMQLNALLTPKTEEDRNTALRDKLNARAEYDREIVVAWGKLDDYCQAPTGDTIAERSRRRELALTARAAQDDLNTKAIILGGKPPFGSDKLISEAALSGAERLCPI